MTNDLVLFSTSSDPIFCVAFYRLSLHSVSLLFLSLFFLFSSLSFVRAIIADTSNAAWEREKENGTKR
jgi:hypothetical protein